MAVPDTERRRPSLTMVAKKANVSIATASRVINGITNKASKETIQRVRDAVEELGYRPISVGRALRTRESRLVALIAANMSNPTMAAIAASAESALREAGYIMVLCDSHDRQDLQDEYLLEMRAQLVSGFVLLGAVPSKQLKNFLDAGEPILFINRHAPYDLDAPFVGINNEAAGREIAACFISQGITDPVIVHGPLESSATRERVEAFSQHFLETNGRAISKIGGQGLDHLKIGYDGIAKLLAKNAPPPRGIFCLSDLIAYGVFRGLREHGFDVPQDCMVMGFDDNPLNDWVAPWLSSMRVPYEAFGPAIVRALRDILAGNQNVEGILPHNLVLRG